MTTKHLWPFFRVWQLETGGPQKEQTVISTIPLLPLKAAHPSCLHLLILRTVDDRNLEDSIPPKPPCRFERVHIEHENPLSFLAHKAALDPYTIGARSVPVPIFFVINSITPARHDTQV